MITRAKLCAHGGLLALVIALVIAINVIFRQPYANQLRMLQQRASKENARNLAKRWNSLLYTELGGGALADVALDRIDWPGLQLTQVQEAKVKSRLREVLGFLANPQ